MKIYGVFKKKEKKNNKKGGRDIATNRNYLNFFLISFVRSLDLLT